MNKRTLKRNLAALDPNLTLLEARSLANEGRVGFGQDDKETKKRKYTQEKSNLQQKDSALQNVDFIFSLESDFSGGETKCGVEILSQTTSEASSSCSSVDSIPGCKAFVQELEKISELEECWDEESRVKVLNTRQADEIRLLFSPEYLEDIIANEYKKRSRRRFDDYWSRSSVTPVRREVLVDWLVSVQMYTRTTNTTLHLAVDLMDALLYKVMLGVPQLQVAAAAAFWVAYKVMDKSMKVDTLLEFLDTSVTKQMVLEHESNVLKSSNYVHTDGDVTVFINYYLFKIYGDKFPPNIYYCSNYLVEIMLHSSELVSVDAPDKALAALYTALRIFNSWRLFETLDSTHCMDHVTLLNIHKKILKLVKRVSLGECYVYKKYKSSRYYKISKICKLSLL